MTDAGMENAPFLFCSRCGSSKLEARSHRHFQCGACGFEHFVTPSVAVAVILADRAGEILLIRRAKDPGKGRLGLPGGFVDPDETGEEAIQREVEEEVNLKVNRFHYFTSFPNRYPFQGRNYPVLDLFFTATVDTFAGARALLEVQSLISVVPAKLDFNEIAFSSIEKALRLYVTRIQDG